MQSPHRRSRKAARTIPAMGRARERAAQAGSAQGLPRQSPSQAGHPGVVARFGGVWQQPILLENIKFLDAKKERAHPSVLIKTTVRLTPPLPLALDMAWEYQVGRLVIFPNLGEGKWKGEFLYGTKPAKGQLSSICSLQGTGGPSPPGGEDKTERKVGWGMWYLHHGSHQAGLLLQLAPSQRHGFHQTQAAVFPQLCKTLNSFTFTHFSSSILHSFPQNFLQFLGVTQGPCLIKM